MPSRAANATIAGYFYQFDKTILNILGSSEETVCWIEYIENIGIQTASEVTAIQCKYIPSKTYSLSTVREAVVLMLDGFLDRGQASRPIKYLLYAHFRDGNKMPSSYDLSALKQLLTFTKDGQPIVYHESKGISDAKLEEFTARLTLQDGPDIDEQQQNVLAALKDIFKCSDLDANVLYYNNALRVVRDLAKQENENDRQISRREFIERIDVKLVLFNRWYFERRGEDEYRRLLRERIAASEALNPQRKITLFVGEHLLGQAGGNLHLHVLIETLVSRFYRLGHVFYNVVPLTVVLDCSIVDANAVKAVLIERDVIYNDGFEGVRFSANAFNRRPVINRVRQGNSGVAPRVSVASYVIRLISAETLLNHSASIEPPDSVLFFSDNNPLQYFPSANSQVFSIIATSREDVLAICRR